MNKQDLISKIKQLDGISQDERAYLINLVNTKKKYGLVWEDKPEDFEEQLRENLPVLKEVKDKAIINGEDYPNHILIEGDNLHALTALTFTHEGKIDVIYIDPPYNTGAKEDFIYNDHYVDKEDAFRHSKWLSFMHRRLRIAKSLLKEDGVIFCSIGDDEISQLTLLFNEIFTENNKLGIIARVAKTAGDKGSYFAPSKDYVIAFTKNKTLLSDFKDGVDETLFKKIELDGPKKGEKYRDDVAFYQSSLDPMRGCVNQRYFVEAPDGSLLLPPGNIFPNEKTDGAKLPPLTAEDKVWRWSVDTYLKQKELLVFKKSKQSPLLDENGNRAKWNIYTKSYLNDRSEKGASPRDYLDQFINRKGADLIKQYDIDFSYSKPFELIQHLLKITNKSNDITVLDFFAGSGTALHAVMSLNELDKGTRTCIISTNNENNICKEVTYPRCERTINPYTNKKGKEMPSFPNNNLRYYKSEFVSRDTSLKNKRELTYLATELLCIKEDCYTAFPSKEKWFKAFTSKTAQFIVIYDEVRIEDSFEIIEALHTQKTNDNPVKVYVFSHGQYPFTEDFEEVLPLITLCALPDAIYKAYQNVLPKKKREVVPVLEEDALGEEENLFNQDVH
jgi:adenine-specific DNA-methyltransferase